MTREETRARFALEVLWRTFNVAADGYLHLREKKTKSRVCGYLQPLTCLRGVRDERAEGGCLPFGRSGVGDRMSTCLVQSGRKIDASEEFGDLTGRSPPGPKLPRPDCWLALSCHAMPCPGQKKSWVVGREHRREGGWRTYVQPPTPFTVYCPIFVAFLFLHRLLIRCIPHFCRLISLFRAGLALPFLLRRHLAF